MPRSSGSIRHSARLRQQVLGARPFDVARRIVIPLALPGLLTSAAFSLLVSFNDVIVSL